MTADAITNQPLSALDVTSPSAYADFDGIHEKYRRLRAEAPVSWQECEGYLPYWAVTKYDDVIEIERQNELFINDPRLTLMEEEVIDAIKEQTGGDRHIIRSLVDMDNPDHFKYRKLTQAWFMPGNIKPLEDKIRAFAKTVVGKMAAMTDDNGVGECDFVNDVAVWYPLRVIMQILGVPEEDEPRMLQLTQELFGGTDEEIARSDQGIDANVVLDFAMYFAAITADRRENPRDDVATVIANAEIDGAPIGDLEAMSYYIIVATAGHDTTSSSVAGGMLELIRNPDQLQLLKDNPDLLSGAVEEMIRWTTPVKHFCRTATADYELRGQTIKKGDSLALFYAAANRDEDAFDDPYKFDVTRTTKQLSFGHGAHMCLGMHLARMEMRILYEELLKRLTSVELVGEPAYVAANFVSGLKRLPIKFKFD